MPWRCVSGSQSIRLMGDLRDLSAPALGSRYVQQIVAEILEEVDCPSAVRRVSERFIAQFAAMNDAYLRERAVDVRDAPSAAAQPSGA